MSASPEAAKGSDPDCRASLRALRAVSRARVAGSRASCPGHNRALNPQAALAMSSAAGKLHSAQYSRREVRGALLVQRGRRGFDMADV